jgi:hypothetical protein
MNGAHGDALRYKPEGHRFDFRRCDWIFHSHNASSHTMALGSASKRNEYEECFLEVNAAGA